MAARFRAGRESTNPMSGHRGVAALVLLGRLREPIRPWLPPCLAETEGLHLRCMTWHGQCVLPRGALRP